MNTGRYLRVLQTTGSCNETSHQHYFPGHKTLPQLFEAQVAKTPDAVAVVFNDKQLTYDELNKRSNQLANHIRSTYLVAKRDALMPDALIPLCLERSIDLVVAIIATLKAGAAYVPISPDCPQERMQYIMDDIGAVLLVTQTSLLKKVGILAPKMMNVLVDDDGCYRECSDNLPKHSKASDLAYVIYTSGTTGQPKGVMISNGAYSFFIKNFLGMLELPKQEPISMLSLTNYVFDIFGLEYAMPLISGGRVILSSLSLVTETEISKSNLVQQTPRVLLALCERYGDFLKNKTCIVGGELSNGKIVETLLHCFKEVFNVYGPTETTVWSTIHQFENKDQYAIIGRPLSNEKVYLLDSSLSPVKIGEIGELYIGGVGLARGYLNLPELTKKAFIDNPFSTEDDVLKGYTRLYKTGDLCRYLEDGNIEYVGRSDFQVKIRGFRVELGEVEDKLSRIEGIKQSCVIIKKGQSQAYLVGYYVQANDSDLTTDKIRVQLETFLPEYMVPSHLVRIESLPLTVNGKLDRSALPDHHHSSVRSYVKPVSETQKRLCRIWENVLDTRPIGIEDNFFEIGGDSIAGIKFSCMASDEFEKEIHTAYLFKYRTIRRLAAHIDSSVSMPSIEIQVTKGDKWPLSFSQQRLYFIEQYEKGTNVYHVPWLVSLSRDINVEALKRSIQAIADRQKVLQTTFLQDDSGMIWQHFGSEPIKIESRVYRSKTHFNELLVSDVNTPFNLLSDYPMRSVLYQNDTSRYTHLLINIHHIATDGWSHDILVGTLLEYYEYFDRGEKIALAPPRIQYKDFAVWQRSYLNKEVLRYQLEYWKGKLSGYKTLNLPTDKSRPKRLMLHGRSVNFALDETLSDSLKVLAKTRGETLYTLMLTGFYILLYKLTMQQDIILATPVANRHYSGVQGLIGFFVNNLVLRQDINPKETANFLLHSVTDNLIQAQSYQDVPFEQLVAELEIEKDISRHPIFQILFSVQSFETYNSVEVTRYFTTETLQGIHNVTRFDLECIVNNLGKKISGVITYSTSLFDKQTINTFAKQYSCILGQLVNEASTKPIAKYNLIDNRKYQKITDTWNKTQCPFPGHKTLPQLFEAQVAKTPDAVAVVFNDKQLTYDELNKRSNQLANHIRSTYLVAKRDALMPDALIPLCLERSIDLVVAIIATLKAGAAYVPISPDCPQERMQYIMDDIGAVLLVTQTSLLKKVGILAPKMMNVLVDDDGCYRECSDNLPKHSKASDLAYVIYTSGTTGQPKGVMIEHTSIVNLIQCLNANHPLFVDEQVTFFCAYVFDVSVAEIFNAITQGATLHILSELCRTDATILSNYLLEYGICQCYLPPSILSLLPTVDYSKLRAILYAGEPCNPQTASHWSKVSSLCNYYGPTETTVYATRKDINRDEVEQIGRPIQNVKTYILNQNLHVVDIGEQGELYIGGVGLARGYLNLPELTKKAFIDNPFSTEDDVLKGYTRLYKTGDLCRYLEDGNIEYVGRSDFQVKIRGFRVELGEVEDKLSRIEGIKQSCVIIKKGQSQAYLVGYYVQANDSDLTTDKIRVQLETFLPEYMVPSHLVRIESLPLTVNGKLDRSALPDHHHSSVRSYVKPVSETQKRLCRIWENVLDTRPIGIEDNFFEIGGNSILSITVAHQMSQFLGCSIYVSDIFRLKTINSIIKKCSNVTFNLIKPLSPEQNKKDIIYFIHPAFSGCEVYQGLVDKLSDFYCCIGVDNYNLHHDQKINVLSELAFHYLSYLDFDNTEGKKILLLGWSLGGLIALEMAYMLEQFYPEKVATRLILLDSHLPRGKTLTYHPHFDPQKGEQTIDEFVDTLIKGLDKTYAEKVLMNKGTEILLGQTKPSGKLGLTRVTLFKALKNSGYKWKDNNLKHYANSFDVVEVNSDHMQMITTILNEWDRYSPIFLGETNFNSQISRSFNFLKRIVEVLKSREMVTSIIALIGFVVYFMISSGD